MEWELQQSTISNENIKFKGNIMQIQHQIQYPQQNFTSSFIRKEAVVAYKKLDPKFLKKVEEQGIPQGFIVSLINRLQLKAKSETLTATTLGKLLIQKINQALKMLKSGKTVEDMSIALKTEKKRIIAFVNKQEQIKRNNEIAEAFLNGESIKSLAERHKRSTRTIGLILRNKGIRPDSVANARRNNVIDMVKNNFTDELISDTLGLSLKHIQSIRAHNKLLKNRSNGPKPREQFIIDQLRLGRNREEFSAETGISMNIINNVSRKFKVKEKMLEERNTKIIEMLQNNIPVKQIAKEFNIDKTVIYKIAKRYKFHLS